MRKEDVDAFVGKNKIYYEEKWGRGTRASWNGGAFLFHIVWLGFRKMYLYVVLFLLALTAAHALAYISGWNYALPLINITIPALLVVLTAMGILGFYGNHLYYKRALHKVRRLEERGVTDREARLLSLQASGGTSKLGIVFVVCASAVAHFTSHILFPTNIDIIQKVKNSSLYNYPIYEIGESFEEYFQQPSWTYSAVPDGLQLVEFQGTNSGRGEVKVQFLVDYRMEEIELYTLKVNGRKQGEEELSKILDEIFRVKTPFELDDGLDEESDKSAM